MKLLQTSKLVALKINVFSSCKISVCLQGVETKEEAVIKTETWGWEKVSGGELGIMKRNRVTTCGTLQTWHIDRTKYCRYLLQVVTSWELRCTLLACRGHGRHRPFQILHDNKYPCMILIPFIVTVILCTHKFMMTLQTHRADRIQQISHRYTINLLQN